MVIADLKDSADGKKISLLEIQFWKALLSRLIVEQFFRGGTKFSEKLVPGTKIFSKNFVPPEQNSSDRCTHVFWQKMDNLITKPRLSRKRNFVLLVATKPDDFCCVDALHRQ